MKKRGPWTTLSEHVAYETPWIAVSHHDVVDPGGRQGVYGVIHFKNLAVGILPLDAQGNTWIVGQYRYPLEAYSWEIPEGGGQRDVPPLESAKRELREETGIVAARWSKILEMDLSNSASDERAILYLAQGPGIPPGHAGPRRRVGTAQAALRGTLRHGGARRGAGQPHGGRRAEGAADATGRPIRAIDVKVLAHPRGSPELRGPAVPGIVRHRPRRTEDHEDHTDRCRRAGMHALAGADNATRHRGPGAFGPRACNTSRRSPIAAMDGSSPPPQGGTIWVISDSMTVLPQPFLNIWYKLWFSGEQGLIGLAFDPDYAENGHFYVNYTQPDSLGHNTTSPASP
jgi:hypothetical protein